MPKYFKFKRIGPGILGVEFKKHIHMSLMFMRLQEYTEGIKKLRGSIFSEGNTLIHYLEKRKTLYYTDEWAGYNIRGDILLEVQNLYDYTVWNDYEIQLLQKINEVFGYKNPECFVIAWVKGDKATKKHEICHANFYLDLNYRASVYQVLNTADIAKAKKYLKKMGYNVSKTDLGRYILMDEINAYAMTDGKKEVKALGLSRKTLRKLRNLYKTYVK